MLGRDGTNGRDGRDGRDGAAGMPGAPGSNASCSSGGGVGGVSKAIAFPLFESSDATWLNLNRTEVPTVGKNEVLGIVTYGMEKYYHKQATPQYICRFENADGKRLYSAYSPLTPHERNSPYYNIGCRLPNATVWPTNKRRTTVTVWFQNRTELKFTGRAGDDNQIDFLTWWSSFTYTTATGEVIIRGGGFNPSVEYTAKFTWPNGTVLSVKANPNAFTSVIFSLKPHQKGFVGKNSVTITIDSASGVVPYKGSAGGNKVVLQEPAKHAACQTAIVLKDAWRKKSNRDQSNVRCDQSTLSVGWYRIDASIGGKLPETCVPKLSCGTHAPGWLQGTHPTVVGVEVSDTVCFHWGSNCCNWNAAVKVVNCGAYYVYYFNRTPVCSLAYCGDV